MPPLTHATVTQDELSRFQLQLPESAVKFIKTAAIQHDMKSPAEFVLHLLEKHTAYTPPEPTKGKS